MKRGRKVIHTQKTLDRASKMVKENVLYRYQIAEKCKMSVDSLWYHTFPGAKDKRKITTAKWVKSHKKQKKQYDMKFYQLSKRR